MAGFFRKLFGGSSKAATPSALAGDDAAALADRLCSADILVFAAFEGDGLDPSTMTREELLAAVERAAKDLAERSDGFEPFTYERDGVRRLPFFTSDEHAQTFVASYSEERGRVFPFQMLGIRGDLLAKLWPACDQLVMNDRTAEEFVLPDITVDAMLAAFSANLAD